MADLLNISKGIFNANGNTTENIQTSAIMRIANATEAMANATEAMAKNYNDLQYWHDHYKNQSKERLERIEALNRSISSYKGQITKLKKKLS